MNNQEMGSNELEERSDSKTELLAESLHLDTEIEKAEAEKNRQLMKRNELRAEYNAIKQSIFWKVLGKGYRTLKISLQYAKGKRSWRQLFDDSIDKKRAKNRIKKLKYSLYELGFTKKALNELEKIVAKPPNKHVEKLAAWELALWHANQYSELGAKKSLDFLSIVKKDEKDRGYLRRIAILQAECLEILGEKNQAKIVINEALQLEEHADLYLAYANLEENLTQRLVWINKVLSIYDMQSITLTKSDSITAYDSLEAKTEIVADDTQQAKVTVLMPVYNAEDVLHTSINSILNQTWSNLEIIVIDDCSTDNTIKVAEQISSKDNRVKLVKAEKNGGAYIARNLGLQIATGDFVTINDADDWSHPEKLEVQVKHLLRNKEAIANTTQQARATEDLTFYRRGKPGEYLFPNMSSLMFRRMPVMEKLGYWDCVRFGADGEFKRRLKLVFGDNAVVDIKTGPYSFQRQSIGSLTGNEVFGFHGYFMGARKEYFDSYSYHHEIATSYKYDFPTTERLYPVPEPMLPERQKSTVRHFDVIIASEFRLLGGTNMSNVEEIKAQKQMGLKTGLIQLYRYDFQSEKQTNPKVRELIDGKNVQMLVYGEDVSCDVLIVRHPPVLQEWQKYIPNVNARTVKVIVNQPPKRDYSEQGITLYTIETCAKHLEEYFKTRGKWYPIGPLVRESLVNYHAKELRHIKLSNEDWVNIINVEEWKRAKRPKPTGNIKIGRHSRSQYVKWPADKEQLLSIYPENDNFEIHVLGGADAPKKVIGYIPSNWKVLQFGELHPREFLASIDVFVYYTHPDWIEAFGRVIFEAMAAGVPVIIPPVYEQLFGEAAIYAEPHEVQQKVKEIMNNEHLYEEQVKKSLEYIEKKFGYTKHASRLEGFFVEEHSYVIE